MNKNKKIFLPLSLHAIRPLFFIFVFVFVFQLMPAWSFTLNNNNEAVFPDNDVFVNVVDVSCENIGLSHDQLLGLIQKAVDQYWNTVPTSRLRIKKGKKVAGDENQMKSESLCTADSYVSSTSPCTPNNLFMFDNGINFVCNQNTSDFQLNSSVLAVTLPFINQKKIKSAVILINDLPDNIRANPWKNLNENQILSVLAHEIGHAFGLGHSDVKDSLMYFSIIPQRENLGWDDIDGLSYLYSNKDYFLGSGFCGQIHFMNHHDNDDHHSTDSTQSTQFMLSLLMGLLSIFLIPRITSFLSYAFTFMHKLTR